MKKRDVNVQYILYGARLEPYVYNTLQAAEQAYRYEELMNKSNPTLVRVTTKMEVLKG